MLSKVLEETNPLKTGLLEKDSFIFSVVNGAM